MSDHTVNRIQFQQSLMISLMVVVLFLSFSYLWRVTHTEPPFVLEQTAQPIITEPLCPGDDLGYRVRFQVRSDSTVVAIIRSWWDVDGGRTAAFDSAPRWAVWDATAFDLETAAAIPLLPPGNYEMRLAAVDFANPPATVRVPFTIGENCE